MTSHSTLAPPLPWVKQHGKLIPQGGRVLDLACGSGRHTRWLRTAGYSVVAVDRDLSGIMDLGSAADVELRELDLEQADWPLSGERFSGIVVTNYLHRPRLAQLAECLTHSGVLIYSTFAAGNEAFGKPSNPAFLLQPRELLEVYGDRLAVIAYSEGERAEPNPAIRQEICAVGPAHPAARAVSG